MTPEVRLHLTRFAIMGKWCAVFLSLLCLLAMRDLAGAAQFALAAALGFHSTRGQSWNGQRKEPTP